jgi:hypothetical protein
MSGRVVHVADRVPGARYIGRANPRHGLPASPLANPYRIGQHGDRLEVVALYDELLWRLITGTAVDPHHPDPSFWADQVIACRNTPLACWCRHDRVAQEPENICHGDVILGLLDTMTDDDLRALARGEAP